MRISDWSSDVCSSDLGSAPAGGQLPFGLQRCPTEMTLASAPEDWYRDEPVYGGNSMPVEEVRAWAVDQPGFEGIWIDRAHNGWVRSEEHTSELQSLMRISYAVFCLKKKKRLLNHKRT